VEISRKLWTDVVEETSVSDPHDLVQHYWLFVIIIADVVLGLPSVPGPQCWYFSIWGSIFGLGGLTDARVGRGLKSLLFSP
jgi:hypothetical protein